MRSVGGFPQIGCWGANRPASRNGERVKYHGTLLDLHAAIQELNCPETLKLLNIDESLLDLPGTTLSYIERCDQWKKLLDVVGSIPHLIDQSSRDYVPLVGFWGHFSSGKSTLINAMMEIGGDEYPPYRRKTGRNPTDKRITLTTHFDGFEATRLEFASSADDVDVVQGPRSAVLERMTLVDTPGLGDDPAEMEAVIRFLHLVHVLVLTVDGRRPFADTEKDFHLLDMAFNRLAGVPKIFAVTSAVDFLQDRKGDFDTDWGDAEAEEFWEETIRRLAADRRFGEHVKTLARTPHHFVDSIEGFRIEQLMGSIDPAVLDDEQRERTDLARAEYVVKSSVESLDYLQDYVGERSRNLAALRADAEQRSQTTQTAIENLIGDLGRRLSSEVEFLTGNRRSGDELATPVDQIVTIETVSRGMDVAETESVMRGVLEQVAESRRHTLIRRANESYRKRTRESDEPFRSEVLVEADIDAAVERTELLDQLKRSGRDAATAALARHGATRTTGLEILERRWERTRVSSSVRDIQKELEGFGRTHDDTVKALIAYITQPSSLELLREHGFVGFDESGQRRAMPESIDVHNGNEYRRFMNEVEQCTASLKRIYDEAAEELEGIELGDGITVAEGADGSVPEGPGKSALKPVVDRVTEGVLAAVDELDEAVGAQIVELAKKVVVARTEKTARVREIWKARGRVVLRVVGVVLVFGIVAFSIEGLKPGVWASLWSSLPQWMIEGAVSGVVASLVLSVCAFVLIGFSNANLRAAFGSTLLARVTLESLQRAQKKKIRKACVEGMDKLQKKAAEAVNSVDGLLLQAVIEWLEEECEAYMASVRGLGKIRERVNERAQLVRGLGNKLSEFRSSVMADSRQRSEQIRSAAVSTHMSTIRQAAEDVENLRQAIVGIAENARD